MKNTLSTQQNNNSTKSQFLYDRSTYSDFLNTRENVELRAILEKQNIFGLTIN